MSARKPTTSAIAARRVTSPALHPEPAPEIVGFVELSLEAAERHGQDSDPDHEIGDLQQLVALLWEHLPPEGRRAVAEEWEPWGIERPDPAGLTDGQIRALRAEGADAEDHALVAVCDAAIAARAARATVTETGTSKRRR